MTTYFSLAYFTGKILFEILIKFFLLKGNISIFNKYFK